MQAFSLPEGYESKFLLPLSTQIARHTCQILLPDGNGFIKPLGTGVFATLNNRHFMFTAAHVMADEHLSELLVSIGGHDFAAITGRLYRADLSRDILADMAFIELDDRTVKNISSSFEFLTESKICPRTVLKDNIHYGTFAYPEKNFIKDKDGVLSLAAFSLHNTSKLKVYKYYGFDFEKHIVLNNTGKAVNLDANQRQSNNITPHGSSGGGIWELSISGTEDEFLTEYCLIGVLTEYRIAKYLVLAGCRIELIIDKIKSLP